SRKVRRTSGSTTSNSGISPVASPTAAAMNSRAWRMYQLATTPDQLRWRCGQPTDRAKWKTSGVRAYCQAPSSTNTGSRIASGPPITGVIARIEATATDTPTNGRVGGADGVRSRATAPAAPVRVASTIRMVVVPGEVVVAPGWLVRKVPIARYTKPAKSSQVPGPLGTVPF